MKAPNRIEVSEFGFEYITKLPADLEELNQVESQDKENTSLCQEHIQRKGKTLDFRYFANQTQNLLHRQTSGMIPKLPKTASESKRKLQLHHDHWMSEQKLINHKLADIQSRLQQKKYSEYDWRLVSDNLKGQSQGIVYPFDERRQHFRLRTKQKLKRLLVRKYPNRNGV